jgi:hypothetical protein
MLQLKRIASQQRDIISDHSYENRLQVIVFDKDIQTNVLTRSAQKVLGNVREAYFSVSHILKNETSHLFKFVYLFVI